MPLTVAEQRVTAVFPVDEPTVRTHMTATLTPVPVATGCSRIIAQWDPVPWYFRGGMG